MGSVTTPLRVLLIDDDEDDATLVVRTLRQGGHEVAVERVDTAPALLAALDHQTWDIAIADYTMPRFSGTAALQIVRDRDPDLPFIFVSGAIGEDAAVAAMRIGAHDYILKGNLMRLVPAVDRELREAAVRRERRRAEQRIAYLAYHDALTDLPNRALLHDRLDQAARIANREGTPLALLLLDLDGFKEVNDTLGHHAGDRVLQQVASRARTTVREADTVARLGGDEFAIVLPFTDVDGAVLAAMKVRQELERPILIDGTPVTVRASVGVACFPEHGATAQALLQKSDVAMYLAKGDGAGVVVYAPERDRHTHRRLTLIAELRQAIERREFLLDYQPIVHLRTGATIGLEALVRWDHPEYGSVPPADFIKLAEQTGLINPLTMLILDKALGEWSAVETVTPLSIAVNVSPRNLQDPDLPQRITEALRAHGARASMLTLEITENVLMADPARCMECLTRLHAMGVRIAIDDFGTGYSSLGYLRRLPIDELKIDRSFVADLQSGHDDVLVRSTIELAHNLGLTVTSEGVEAAVARERLTALGCDAAQGGFIAPPAPAQQLRAWMASKGALGLS
jgi:diguanylate cyclase (GGDEF)-like protein